MRTTKPLTLMAALAPLLMCVPGAVAQNIAQSTAAEAAAEVGVKRIIPGGQDGDRSYYVVTCASNDRASVIVEHATAETCATPRGGAPRCEKEWTLQDAAAHACNGAQGG